jgi:hypothetical protein
MCSVSKKDQLVFKAEFTWKSFEEHFQIYNWLDEPKQEFF